MVFSVALSHLGSILVLKHNLKAAQVRARSVQVLEISVPLPRWLQHTFNGVLGCTTMGMVLWWSGLVLGGLLGRIQAVQFIPGGISEVPQHCASTDRRAVAS